MEVLYPCCCGLDVHKATVVACLLRPDADCRRAVLYTYVQSAAAENGMARCPSPRLPGVDRSAARRARRHLDHWRHGGSGRAARWAGADPQPIVVSRPVVAYAAGVPPSPTVTTATMPISACGIPVSGSGTKQSAT